MSGAEDLTEEFGKLAELMGSVQFPLPLEGVAEHRQTATVVSAQLRDYLIPRSQRLDAPLLVVVGGSTGAGKSTLVNSLLGEHVTRPGVLRPTTKSPVLICHPDDRNWFASGRILPLLTRSEQYVHDSRALQLVVRDSLPAGLALLDAPDIDSIDGDNRKLSRQLLQAADLWLFVTSAARYADAVGWEILDQAAQRDTVISLVLNRSPQESIPELITHLQQMLDERGLQAAKLFAVAEADLEGTDLLPVAAVQPIRNWLAELVSESQRRADVAIQSLAGATRALGPQLEQLAQGLGSQTQALTSLREQAEAAFRRAMFEVHEASSDGTLLRGEVLSRWQDFVGTGEFWRKFEQQISAVRDRLAGWLTGKSTKADQVQVAITDGLAALIVEHTNAAYQHVANTWSVTSWGREIIEANPKLRRPDESLDQRAADLIRRWQSSIMEMVGQQGRSKRFKARLLALGTNVVGAALIIVVFASTGGLTGAEVGIAGGTSLAAQRMLEAIFGDDAVRSLAKQAKADLDERVQIFLAEELAHFESVLDTFEINPETVDALYARAEGLREAVSAVFADLTRPEGY